MNPNTDRRGEFVAGLGALLSLTAAIVIWLVGLFGKSTSVLGLGFVSFGALLVWIVSYAQLHQRRLLEEERFELAELERDRQERLGGSKTIFDESDLQQMDALAMGRRLRTLERWFVPVGGVLVALFWIYAGLRLLPGPLSFQMVADSADAPIENVAVLASFTAGLAFLSFLVSRWAIVLARLPAYHLLRAGGNAMFGVTAASLLTTLGLVGVSAFGAARLERGAAVVLAVLMLVLAVEALTNFVLDFYRPRIAGVVQRSFFDSRVLGMFSEPGGVLKSLADAVDYQFGFKVSETWFYQLLGRWIVPLLLVQAALLWLMTGVVVVPQGYEAVIEHFHIGDAAVDVRSPGVTMKWPWPIDRATLVPSERIQRFEIGYDRAAEASAPPRLPNEPELWTKKHRKVEFELLVPDRKAAADESLPLNLISVTIPIQWRVKPGATLSYHQNARDVPQLVEALSYRVLTRFAGQADVLDLLSAGGATAADRIQAALQKELDHAGINGGELGVQIVHLSLANVHPATSAAEAYEATIAAYQEKETRIREAGGKADQERVSAGGLAYQAVYDAIVAEEEAREAARQAAQSGGDAASAERTLQQRTEAVERLLRTESGGEARAIVARAERRGYATAMGEAARAELYGIQSQAFGLAPEIYRLRQYLRALEDALRGARKYVLALRNNDRVRIIYDDGAGVEAGLIQTTLQGLKKEERDMKRGPTIVVAIIVVVVLLLYAFAFQVRFTETAVVTRFERPVERAVTTGLNFRRLPWPIERVHKYDKRLRSFETQFTQLSTEDQKTLTVAAFAAWRIDDAGQFLRAVGREEAAADKIGDLLKNAVSKVLKRHPLGELINTDPARTKFSGIEDEILASIAADARKSYGIDVTTVGIARLGLPEKNTQAVADRMKADRKKESDRLTAEGDAEARKLTETARAVAAKITERARAYAKTIEGEGERLAASYYGVFRENPELATELKKWETLTRVFSSGETTIVLEADQAFPPFELLQPPPVATDGAGKPRADSTGKRRTGAPGGGKPSADVDDVPPLGGESDAKSN